MSCNLTGAQLCSLLNRYPAACLIPILLATTAMEAFEDENPFENEPDHAHSDNSSRVNVSGAPSPQFDPQSIRVASPPTSPSKRNAFPSPGTNRHPQAFKHDFCCSRDNWLHSGEDIEILVSVFAQLQLYAEGGMKRGRGCAQLLCGRLSMRSRRLPTRPRRTLHTSFEQG